MLRVLNEDSLATRNGRLINENFQEYSPLPSRSCKRNIHICYDDMISGHTCAGSTKFNYTLLIKSKKFFIRKSLFNLSDLRWKDVFLWQ